MARLRLAALAVDDSSGRRHRTPQLRLALLRATLPLFHLRDLQRVAQLECRPQPVEPTRVSLPDSPRRRSPRLAYARVRCFSRGSRAVTACQ